jgi:hypothetical protein
VVLAVARGFKSDLLIFAQDGRKFVSAFPITYAARLDAATKLHGISSSMRL